MPAEATSNFVAAFLDLHGGFAQLPITVTGTNVIAGDVVAVTLTSPNAVGASAPLAGGLASQAAVNTLVGGNIVTPIVVGPVSYTATAGDAAQATLPLKLQAMALGLVAALNASGAVIGGTAVLQTVSAPTNASATLVALLPGAGGALPGFVAGITMNSAATSTPGGAGHAILTPGGATNPFTPQNVNLHYPVNDARFVYSPGPNQTVSIDLTGGEPIFLDPSVYAAALAAGLVFNF